MTEYSRKPHVRSRIYRDPLRVGTVANICRVTNKTIFNWITQGALRTFTTHGGHNRIWPADLQAFLDRAGMDVEFRFEDHRQIRFLVVDDKPGQRILLLKSLCDRFPSASVLAAQNVCEALLLVGELKPKVVTWNLSMPRFDGARIIEFLTGRKMDGAIHVTLYHHVCPEKVTWCLYTDALQETKMRTGLDEMLDALQMLLIPPGRPAGSELAPIAPGAMPTRQDTEEQHLMAMSDSSSHQQLRHPW